MAKIALFAGSFDPFTRGHEAVVEVALQLFDEVVVGVGANVSKKGLLSVEQRCRLIEDVYKDEKTEYKRIRFYILHPLFHKVFFELFVLRYQP